MGQHAAIGRAAQRAAGLQHRGMEPPPVLIGAFQIKVGNPIGRAIGAVAQHEGMGRAGVEPHIQHVEDLFKILRIVVRSKDFFLESLHIPHIGPVGPECRDDAGIDACVAQQEIRVGGFGTLAHKAGHRHAPGALPRQHPVGARRDHRMQAVAATGGGPLHQLVDAGQGAGADGVAVSALAIVKGLVDGHKPLRRVAVDQRGF